jgi:hypothetical protein
MHTTQTRFWTLNPAQSTNKLAEWDDDKVKTERIVCPAREGDRRGGRRLTDLSVVLPGRRVEDFVWTWLSECLIQDQVLALFQTKGFTGFEAKPVSARFKKGADLPPTLWELVVTGWGGLAPETSGIRLRERCDACGFLGYSGLQAPAQLIDESQWDGRDFFMVWPLPVFILVTDRVWAAIRDAKFTGAFLKPVNELAVTDGYSPGRLSYWMPEKRAHELGDSLGIY